MTDDQPDRVPMDARIHVGVDAVGDPFLVLHIVTPPGAGLPADDADKLALKILAAAASARVRAGVVRDQLLAGVDPESAIAFVNGLLHELPGE